MQSMDLITLLAGSLATARLTRLVTTDRITQAPRLWLAAKLPEGGLAQYLITCDWCASVYAGACVALGLCYAGPSALWVCAALSFSYVAGWLASREGE